MSADESALDLDIVGVDEAGRGPWAGPICFAAVTLMKVPKALGVQLKDSKTISPSKREQIFCQLQQSKVAIGVSWASPNQIDELGLTRCSVIGMSAAVAQIFKNQAVVVDGNYNYLKDIYDSSQAIIKADSRFACVSAASIVAKVLRDRYMKKCSTRYQGFGFEKHLGYGTSEHRQALQDYGPSKLHRFSFRPVSEIAHVD